MNSSSCSRAGATFCAMIREYLAIRSRCLPVSKSRITVRARATRVAGQESLVVVDDIARLPQVILDTARAGDVVMCMGAGSIGQTPSQVLALSAASNTEATA